MVLPLLWITCSFPRSGLSQGLWRLIFFYPCFLLSQSRWAQKGKRWLSVILSPSLRQPNKPYASCRQVCAHKLVEKTKSNSLLFSVPDNGQLFLRQISLGSMDPPISINKTGLKHCLIIVHIFSDMVLSCPQYSSPKQCIIQWIAQSVPNRLDHEGAFLQGRRSNQKDSSYLILRFRRGSDAFCLWLSIYPITPKPFTFHVTVQYSPLLNDTWEKILSNHTVSHPKFQSYSSGAVFVRTHPHIKEIQLQL